MPLIKTHTHTQCKREREGEERERERGGEEIETEKRHTNQRKDSLFCVNNVAVGADTKAYNPNIRGQSIPHYLLFKCPSCY